MTRVVGIIQARMGSVRLPGKSLADLAGRPLILHVVERVQACPGLAAVVVTIPRGVEDDPLAAVLRGAGVSFLRNQRPPDLLAAYVKTSRAMEADVVMRVTGDNPLWAPDVGATALALMLASDGKHTVRDVRYPGQDVEIFQASRLEIRHACVRLSHETREHVLPGGGFVFPVDPAAPWLSVDTAEDLARVRAVHAELDDPTDHTLAATLRAWERAGRP
jgi:spore coat polysaccharide biosynthesis protein SpsF (cytidylyltransferase family)